MATAARFTLVIFSVAMRIYANISMARMTSVISLILLYSLHFERKGNNYFVIANISVSFLMNLTHFHTNENFVRFFLSLLFIFPLHFIIESDENTDNREEHHRKKYRGGSYQNIKRLCLYILYVFPRRSPPKIAILVKYY